MGKFGPISGHAITLANSIIGVGILAMPFCFQQCGILLSIVLLILSGFMSRLASHFLVKSAIKSRRRNFEVLAYYVFGNSGKFFVEIGIIGFLMGTCIAYFVVIGDLGPQIIAKLFGINYSSNLRVGIMFIISLICVLPLGLLKNVDSLSNVCMITIVFYFCLVLKIIAEAANPMFSGEWINTVEYWKPDGILRCLPIFSMSLFCQTQLFEIYDILPNASLEKMNAVTKNAVTICSIVYILVGFFGYIAFCNQSILGNILTNLSPTIMTEVIKMGFVMSLAFSFPLIIFPCRVSLYSLLYKKGQVGPHDLMGNMMPDNRFKYLTIFIIGITLLISLMLPNIELVLGFVGSTIGVIICVIFPAACFICITFKNTNERVLAQIVLCFGIIIMVLGTYANLQASDIDNMNSGYKVQIKQNNYNPDNKIVKDFQHEISKNNEGAKLDTVNKISNIHLIEEKKDFRLESFIIDEKKDLRLELPKVDEKKESRLEPPNPLPPKVDLHSKEDKNNGNQIGDKNSENDLVVQMIDTNNRKNKINSNENIEHLKPTTILNLPKQDVSITEKKNEEMKKEDLLETIKRHEKEQREIIQEQKEILKEIKKTKKELEEENLKNAEDHKLNQIENKKIAVESIQKLAKLAIESLGGKLDTMTESLIKHLPTEKVMDKNNIDKVFDDKTAQKNNSKEVQTHKKHESESYQMGENINQINVNKELVKNENELSAHNLGEKPPIPIALFKLKENAMDIQSIHVNQSRKVDQNKMMNDNNSPNILNLTEVNHVGGRRDILEVNDENVIENKKSRFKREINKCDDEKLENEPKIVNELDSSIKEVLKLSMMLTEPENLIKKHPSISTENLSNSNFVKQTIGTN